MPQVQTSRKYRIGSNREQRGFRAPRPITNSFGFFHEFMMGTSVGGNTSWLFGFTNSNPNSVSPMGIAAAQPGNTSGKYGCSSNKHRKAALHNLIGGCQQSGW